MSIPTITLAQAPGIPLGFSLLNEMIDGENVHFLRRDIDDRRARIIWKPGTQRYTMQQLSAMIAKEADLDNPLLRSQQEQPPQL